MKKKIELLIDEDVLSKVDVALKLSKEDINRVVENMMKDYIISVFSKKIGATEQQSNSPDTEESKLLSKVRRWARNYCVPHDIIKAFLLTYNETLGGANKNAMFELYLSMGGVEKKLNNNYPQMKSNGANAHGKVFYDDRITVFLEDEVKEEVMNMCNLIRDFYSRMGLWDNHWVSLSVRDYEHPEKYIGSKEDWDKCEEMLKEVSDELGLNAVRCEGEAALYGPKLDFMFKDALGREIQIPTVQLDFATPKRFGLFYIDENGEKQVPVIGLGGISTWQDAVEFILAGADAIQVGTSIFANPNCLKEIIQGLYNWMERKGYSSIGEFKGKMLK